MELQLRDKVLELHRKGWAADRIAAQYTIHQHIVKLIIEGDTTVEPKKTIVDVGGKIPKTSKLSK